MENWKKTNGFGIILYPFAGIGANQMRLLPGEAVSVTEETEEWYWGKNIQNEQEGLIPKNYVKIVEKFVPTKEQFEDSEHPIKELDRTVQEVNQTLREWKKLLRNYVSPEQNEKFEFLKESIKELLKMRSEFLSSDLPRLRYKPMKNQMIQKIKQTQETLHLHDLPRDSLGQMAYESNVSFVELNRKFTEIDDSKKAQGLSSAKKNLPRSKSDIHQIQLDFEVCLLPIGSDAELRFWLYKDSKQLTEAYLVNISSTGMHFDLEAHGKLQTIFRDLDTQDVSSGLYLACQIFKYEKITDKKITMTENIKKPFGCGVFNITENLNSITQKKEAKKIPIYRVLPDVPFSKLTSLIIANDQSLVSYDTQGVSVELRRYPGEYDSFINILCEEKQDFESFYRSLKGTRKMGFPNVILPSYIRNDLYITINEANLVQADKKIKNIQLFASVYNKDVKNPNDFIKGAISYGVENPALNTYSSYINLHNNKPQWDETLKIDLPVDQFEHCHLYFEIYIYNEKNGSLQKYAVTHFPFFSEQGTMPAQDQHHLTLHKWVQKIAKDNHFFYLTPEYSNPKMKSKILELPNALTITVNLCSTQMTQRKDITELFKWKDKESNIQSIVKQVTYTPPIEIVKFMREILDTLFIIHGEKGQDVQDSIYEAIIFVIGILVDKRFKNFTPVLNDYISTRFSRSNDSNISQNLHRSLCSVHSSFIEILKETFTKIENDHRKNLLDSMKAIEYTFKFIIYSWLLDIKAKGVVHISERQIHQNEFCMNLNDILSRLTDLLSKTEPVWINAVQETALRHFRTIFTDLGEVMTDTQLATIFAKLIDSVRLGDLKLLNLSKIELILSLVSNPMFKKQDFRAKLLPTILHQINNHMNTSEDLLDLCANIFGHIFSLTSGPDKLESISELFPATRLVFRLIDQNNIFRDSLLKQNPDDKTNSNSQNLMESSFENKSQEAINKRNKTASILVSCILSVFNSMKMGDMYELLRVYSDDFERQQELIRSSLKLFKSLFKNTLFDPKDKILHFGQLLIVLKSLWMFMEVLSSRYNGPNIVIPLWNLLFKLLINIISWKEIQLENYDEFTRQNILEMFGDLRIPASQLLVTFWERLGDQQIVFIPEKVVPVLSLLLLNNNTIQQVSIDVFYSMIVAEVKETGEFIKIEQTTVGMFGSFIIKGQDTEFGTNFFEKLIPKFEANPKLKEKGLTFVEHLRQLITRISKLKTFPDNPKYEDERVSVLIGITEYLLRTQRILMFHKFVHALSDVHFRLNNFSEAAMALTKCIGTLEWDTEKMEPKLEEGHFKYPKESQASRKERIIYEAISLFDQGKLWEQAIELIQILRERYINHTYNYIKLSDLLLKESTFYKQIMTVERFFSSYFRVGYYGKGFETEELKEIKNKEFVYRGAELEQLSVFIERIKQKFPQAQIGSNDPTDAIINGEGQYIQVANLFPAKLDDINWDYVVTPKEEKDKIQTFSIKLNNDMPQQVQKYYNLNNVNIFLYTKPFRKTAEKSQNEFKDLWIRNNYLISESPFPSFCRRLSIVQKVIEELPPIMNAVNSVEKKNIEVNEMIEKYDKTPTQNISPFSMALNGVIDAAVNGGVFRYKEAFFSSEFMSISSTLHLVIRLKRALQKQLQILSAGIIVHDRLCPEEMRPFHDKMETFLKSMKEMLAPSLQDLEKI
ncbi:dedicator of cytokinesis [Anaeramoeba ignava]|uniref:Dedicator of cytokinesis n=1 Tax=Anaeramoeba ignava TaxID=1746090 RepID=A0A9Q0RFM1_ANAIG|nr:dedicator of cytokinesis [Anaeramoeba ignava]